MDVKSPLLLLFSLFVAITALPGQGPAGYPYSIPFERIEVPFYEFQQLQPQVALRMDFASAAITNPNDWLAVRDRGEVEEIDLVFTLYPADQNSWLTGYNQLIKNRLRSLFALDESLQSKDLKWRLVVQTQCGSEEEARNYFHGFVLRYKVTRPLVFGDLSSATEVEQLLSGKAVTHDSTVLKIMDRNRHWKNVLVIMDWTGSMYRFGAQVVLWHKLNQESSGIKHLVLFNDGDGKATWQKQVGRTGGIYYTRCQDLSEVVETLSEVMQNGYGGDSPENDLEAVVQGLQRVPDFDEVVLIADNRSKVRDMSLLKAIKKPVRVVLCGKRRAKIHPDYLRIAYKTRGSIHTVSEDIMAMASLKEGDTIEIEGYRYKVRAGELERFE